jgi:hypothetical protein
MAPSTNVVKLFTALIYEEPQLTGLFVTDTPFQPSIMFAAKAYPRVEHLKGAPLGYAPAFTTNLRLVWKGMPETNALAYFNHS